MLSTLRIRNLALVEDLTVTFQPGLNVITGETGAGKSVLIGGLSLVLGERADRDLIRSGADACSVEAVFDLRTLPDEVAPFLEENGLESCSDDQLLLKRSLSTSGANRQFVNGSPTTLAILSRLGEWLVDIHGPHDHQSLLHTGRQLQILDAFAGLTQERRAFAELVRKYEASRKEKSALIVDEKTYAQQVDLLRFQVNEITAARLRPGEETEVEQEHQRAANSARLLELTQAVAAALNEDEQALMERTGAIGRILQDLERIDPGASSLSQTHRQLVGAALELQSQLSTYAERINLDPDRLRELDERLNLLQGLRRKYGPAVAGVIAFGEEAQKKLQVLEQRDTELERINEHLATVKKQLSAAGNKLTALRRKIIPQLGKAVAKELGLLGFKRSDFSVAISSESQGEEFSMSGFDRIEFKFSPNPGEPPRPLRSIASSGELARVMLALKTVLAGVDQVPVLVFDEVDANIGGETARAVGEKMKRIADKRQVICITHLPQVAAHGSAHFVVNKRVKGARTTSEIELLDSKSRVGELARMLGGQSDAATRHAEALLAEAD